jgi:hypothetical protein
MGTSEVCKKGLKAHRAVGSISTAFSTASDGAGMKHAVYDMEGWYHRYISIEERIASQYGSMLYLDMGIMCISCIQEGTSMKGVLHPGLSQQSRFFNMYNCISSSLYFLG